MQRRGIARTKEDISYFRTLAWSFAAYFVEKVYVHRLLRTLICDWVFFLPLFVGLVLSYDNGLTRLIFTLF